MRPTCASTAPVDPLLQTVITYVNNCRTYHPLLNASACDPPLPPLPPLPPSCSGSQVGVQPACVPTAPVTGPVQAVMNYVDDCRTYHPAAERQRMRPAVLPPSGQGGIWPVCASGAPSLVPDTVIEEGPPPVTNSMSATFKFRSSQPASSFDCRLDSGAWVALLVPEEPIRGWLMVLTPSRYERRTRSGKPTSRPRPRHGGSTRSRRTRGSIPRRPRSRTLRRPSSPSRRMSRRCPSSASWTPVHGRRACRRSATSK